MTPGGFELVFVFVGADGADGKVVHVGHGRRVQTVRRPILKKQNLKTFCNKPLKLIRGIDKGLVLNYNSYSCKRINGNYLLFNP